MSSELVTRYAGFFGKLPTAGDFVWRGLPEEFIARWDRWLTAHVAPLDLPPSGLRFSLVSGGRCLAGVILPSEDRHGRRFPLTLAQILPIRPESAEIDRWCDLALDLPRPDPDTLAAALEALPASAGEALPEGPLRLWTRGARPSEAPIDAPDEALRGALNSSGCSSPSS